MQRLNLVDFMCTHHGSEGQPCYNEVLDSHCSQLYGAQMPSEGLSDGSQRILTYSGENGRTSNLP